MNRFLLQSCMFFLGMDMIFHNSFSTGNLWNIIGEVKPFDFAKKNILKKALFFVNIQWFDNFAKKWWNKFSGWFFLPLTESNGLICGDVPTGFLVSNPGLGATKLQRVLILWCIVHPSPDLERTQRPRPRWQMKLNEKKIKTSVGLKIQRFSAD